MYLGGLNLISAKQISLPILPSVVAVDETPEVTELPNLKVAVTGADTNPNRPCPIP
jgi:hypothetical protein